MELSNSEMKWPLLIIANIRQIMGKDYLFGLPKIVNKLITADPYRSKYYEDTFSKER